MSDTLDIDPEEMYSTALALNNMVNAHRHLAGELRGFAATGAGRPLDLGSLRAAASRLETAAAQIANGVRSISRSLDALQRAEQDAAKTWGDKLRSKLPDWLEDANLPNIRLNVLPGLSGMPSAVWVPGKGAVDTSVDPVEFGLGLVDSAQGVWGLGKTAWQATPWEVYDDIRHGRPTVHQEIGAGLWWVGNSLIHDDPPRRQLIGEILNERAYDEGGFGRWLGKSGGDFLQNLVPGAIVRRIPPPGRPRPGRLPDGSHPFAHSRPASDAALGAQHRTPTADEWYAREIERVESEMDRLLDADRRGPHTDRQVGALQDELFALQSSRQDAKHVAEIDRIRDTMARLPPDHIADLEFGHLQHQIFDLDVEAASRPVRNPHTHPTVRPPAFRPRPQLLTDTAHYADLMGAGRHDSLTAANAAWAEIRARWERWTGAYVTVVNTNADVADLAGHANDARERRHDG